MNSSKSRSKREKNKTIQTKQKLIHSSKNASTETRKHISTLINWLDLSTNGLAYHFVRCLSMLYLSLPHSLPPFDSSFSLWMKLIAFARKFSSIRAKSTYATLTSHTLCCLFLLSTSSAKMFESIEEQMWEKTDEIHAWMEMKGKCWLIFQIWRLHRLRVCISLLSLMHARIENSEMKRKREEIESKSKCAHILIWLLVAVDAMNVKAKRIVKCKHCFIENVLPAIS